MTHILYTNYYTYKFLRAATYRYACNLYVTLSDCTVMLLKVNPSSIHKHATFAICPWKEKQQGCQDVIMVCGSHYHVNSSRSKREDQPSDPVSHLAPLGSTPKIDAFVLSVRTQLGYCSTDQPALSSSSYTTVKPFSLRITVQLELQVM